MRKGASSPRSWPRWPARLRGLRNANGGRGVSPYLTGLLLAGILLGVLGVVLMLLMREMAARATIEAATRLRRAVYHHTFRLGTLAFRALGPTEAVSIFARHIEAVHDAMFTRLTVYYRAPIKIALLIAFALSVQFWLALAFSDVRRSWSGWSADRWPPTFAVMAARPRTRPPSS